MRQFLFLARRDDAAWQVPCKEKQHHQGQKETCLGHLNLNRCGYIVIQFFEPHSSTSNETPFKLLPITLTLFNKPYDVLSQFTDVEGRPTLADYIDLPDIYPAGRLDRDSEGLLILTGNGGVQHRIADPRHKMAKIYWVQIEGMPDEMALNALRQGVKLKDGITQPAKARLIDPPDIWPRTPPIRYRASIPDCWLELTIHEGRNRQVRRMTAAVGHPTLRLIRYGIGPWTIDGMASGEWRAVECPPELLQAIPKLAKQARSKKHGLEPPRHRRRHYRTRR